MLVYQRVPIETDETDEAAGTTVTQHAEVIVDSSFPGWELGRRATASANAHMNNKIITVVTDMSLTLDTFMRFQHIIGKSYFIRFLLLQQRRILINIGNWIRILLFYQFDSIWVCLKIEYP